MKLANKPINVLTDNIVNDDNGTYYEGMTLLEYYAGLTHMGLCANPEFNGIEYRTLAQTAIARAKVLIEELEKEQ